MLWFIVIIAVIIFFGPHFFMRVDGVGKDAAEVMTLIVLITVVIVAEIQELHRHLHVVECATLGYITDRNGERWMDQTDCAQAN